MYLQQRINWNLIRDKIITIVYNLHIKFSNEIILIICRMIFERKVLSEENKASF